MHTFHIHLFFFFGIRFKLIAFWWEKQLAFLTLCDQAFNPPFLGGKINELAKFCFLNERFETNLSFFSKPVIVCHCV